MGGNGVGRAPIEDYRRADGGEERSGCQVAAQALQHHRHLAEPEPRPTVLFGKGQPGPAEFACCRPDIGRMRRAAGQRRPRLCEGIQPRQLPGDGFG